MFTAEKDPSQVDRQHLIPALNEAIDEVIDQHLDALAIQRRFVSDMREIWLMQPRFEKRQGATVHRLLEHIRFRAGYDFMLLRAEAGQCDADIAQWWTDFIDADQATRAELISQAASARHRAGSTTPKPRRRRRKRGESG